MGKLLIEKILNAEDCERLTGNFFRIDARFDPFKLYRVSISENGADCKPDVQPAAQYQVGPLSELEVLRATVKELEALRDARVDEKLSKHQGEPVAHLMEVLAGSMKGKLHLCESYEAFNQLLYRGPFPVYEHADTGEVERLRIERRRMDEALVACANERDTLRAQLAERDALLERAYRVAPPDLGRDIRAALSASAEPSAPYCVTCKDEGAVGNILDTVPCPDCAAAPPVERDERALGYLQDLAEDAHANGNDWERIVKPRLDYIRAALERNK